MDTDQQKVVDLTRKIRFAMLTSRDGDKLVSRPMTPQRVDDDATVYFITQQSEEVAKQSHGQQVNLAFVDGSTFVSISGTGELVNDPGLKKEFWDAATDAFTEGGPEDPENVILAVRADSASYWDSAGAPAFVWNVVRNAVAGKKADQRGEHGTVQL